MKTVSLALVMLSAGLAVGYVGRGVTIENRTQRNLSALSGETLSHLDELGRFTRGFSSEEIDRRWKEHVAVTEVSADINALHDAWQAWQSAIIFREVERVGWTEYRGLIVHSCAKYLKVRPVPEPKISDFAAKEAKRAADMIHDAIPDEMLARETTFY